MGGPLCQASLYQAQTYPSVLLGMWRDEEFAQRERKWGFCHGVSMRLFPLAPFFLNKVEILFSLLSEKKIFCNL